MVFSQKKSLIKILSIAILSWITKPYSFKEYETKTQFIFRNGKYMKTKVEAFISSLSKKLTETSTGTRLVLFIIH